MGLKTKKEVTTASIAPVTQLVYVYIYWGQVNLVVGRDHRKFV